MKQIMERRSIMLRVLGVLNVAIKEKIIKGTYVLGTIGE